MTNKRQRIEIRVHKTQDKYTLENSDEAIKKGQSRESRNIGYTRHRTNKCYRIAMRQSKNGQSRETGNIGYTRQINVREQQ